METSRRKAQEDWSLRAAEILVIAVMPFLYGAQTRLVFIYFVIHLRENYFPNEWLPIGLYVGAYQACRVVTSALSIWFPIVAHFFGTCAGLVGFTIVLVSDKDLEVPFVVGTAIVGLSETMSSMQKYGKDMYRLDPNRKKSQLKLKYQYAFVMLGVVFAFSIGGVVYEKVKINGVAIFGIGITGSSLLSFLLYVALPRKNIVPKDEQALETPSVKEQNFSEENARRGEKRIRRDEEASEDEESARAGQEQIEPVADQEKTRRLSTLINLTDAAYPTADLPATWINWLICCTFGIEALTIGYNLSIGPIFLLNEFKRKTTIIGILFAVGEVVGTTLAVGVTCTNLGRRIMQRIAKSPFDLCIAMCGIAVGVLVAAVLTFGAHIAGLLVLMSFNDLAAILMTELQASLTTSSSFSVVGPAGQVVRRTVNVVTAVTGPLLYGLNTRLPYYVAGGVTIFWTVFTSLALKQRREKSVTEVARRTGRRRQSVAARMSFATTEAAQVMGKRNASLFQVSEDDQELLGL